MTSELERKVILYQLTENIVAKNTPMILTMAQKKSVIVFNLHIDRFDFTTPKILNNHKSLKTKTYNCRKFRKWHPKIK